MPRGDFEITVVAADGKKFKGCTVYAFDQALSFGEGGGPQVAKGIPVENSESTIARRPDTRMRLSLRRTSPTSRPEPMTRLKMPVKRW